MNTRVLKVNCPTCNEIVVWSQDNPYRPFCSQRCKMIDFGDWASERHVIAGESVSQQDDDEENDLY
ncbi:MAG: DNA gyrase inhibitor YacG [Pseudomonadales bacterium]|nr:DNA gyrase inhibitor YacG [Pseudomonadales bacterium]MCP5358746.1 DNA gyrase inhibitor YacG [Pseudomonadales bacterium]